MTSKTTRAPVGARKANTINEVLAEVLGVVSQNEWCFPAQILRARVAISLANGDHLELEFDGTANALVQSGIEPQVDPCHVVDSALEGVEAFKSIADLNLGASAKAAAEKLLEQFPGDVKFTSGRRAIADQALAMAPNVVKNRKWIEQTYKDTPQRTALQKWVDENPGATQAATVAAGLEAVMKGWSEPQQRNFSRHITGDAFDVQPVASAQGNKIKEAIAKLPKLNWNTFTEGGLEIWHAQFDA